MSGDLLREAAALMRERAEAAPTSPWVSRATTDGDPANGPTHMVVENARGLISDHEYDRWGGTSAEHIASWHPDVALAVADWLDRAADEPWCCDECKFALENPQNLAHDALAVARAYLGEEL